MKRHGFPVLIGPLPWTRGGGIRAFAPDLPGCMGGGETPAKAAANVQDAFEFRIEAANHPGHAIPGPPRYMVPETAQ